MGTGKKSSSRGRKAGQGYGRSRSLFVRAAAGFFQYILNSAAYSLRIFLRIRLGERSIGFSTVLLSFVWSCYFLTDEYAIKFVKDDAESPEFLDFLKPFIQILNFLGQVLIKTFNAFINAGYQIGMVEPSTPPSIDYSDPIFWYSYVILLLGIIHLVKIQLRATSKIHIHSYTRGKSAFFWWLEGMSIPWLRGDKKRGRVIVQNVKIVEKTIFTYVEPFFVILCGILLKNNGQDHIAWYLIISAFALLWDERRESVRFRGQVLDMLDGELDGQELIEEYKKIKGEVVESGNFERGARILP